MLQGACHCGSVTWTLDQKPQSATACNCTVCRRYGVLWAYDYENEGITVNGPTSVYSRGKPNANLGFHFCPDCGCVAYWKSTRPDEQGRIRIAVNLRLTEVEPIADVIIDHFDGLDSFDDLPHDGRCVKDLWF